ncbi:MAG: hypothetical protein J6U54_03795 [Clostridiales bacterium]|nr:hypothetical protein [Clostridiales bacterium]
MRSNFDYRNPYFVEITACVLLVFACENSQNNTFKTNDMLSNLGPFARFFWFDVEKVLEDKHYIELANSSASDSEFRITTTGRSFANSYRVQNNIDLDKEPKEIILRIYNK